MPEGDAAAAVSPSIVVGSHEGPAHQRRRHRGRRAAGAAPGAASRCPGVELAVIAPDCNRSATARSITTRRPLWVEEVDFGDGTVGYATDGTPGRLRALRDARADRRLRGRAGRRRHQPRLQPRRRHHLLGHRRRGAGGRRARAAGDRGLPAVRARARWTSASATSSTSTSRRAFVARLVEEHRGRAAARRARCSTSTSRPATPEGVEVDAARQAHLPRRARARATRRTARAPLPDLRRRARLPRRGRAPTSPRSPPGRIAVTPLHFDLTDAPGMEALRAVRPRAPARARRRGGRVSDRAPGGADARRRAARAARAPRPPLLRPRRPRDRRRRLRRAARRAARASRPSTPSCVTPDSPTQRVGGEPVARAGEGHAPAADALARQRAHARRSCAPGSTRMRNHLAREGIEDPRVRVRRRAEDRRPGDLARLPRRRARARRHARQRRDRRGRHPQPAHDRRRSRCASTTRRRCSRSAARSTCRCPTSRRSTSAAPRRACRRS